MSFESWKTSYLKLRSLRILLCDLELLGLHKVKSILDNHASIECVSSIMALVNSHVGFEDILASKVTSLGNTLASVECVSSLMSIVNSESPGFEHILGNEVILKGLVEG